MEKYKTLNLKLRQENNIQSDQVRLGNVNRPWTGSKPEVNRMYAWSDQEYYLNHDYKLN